MRLFAAIELERGIKKALKAVQERLREYSGSVRWTKPEQMHLTLKFLGEVADDCVEEVCSAAKQVAGESVPFDLTLGECGCFPPRGAVRIVQVGIAQSDGELGRCRERCEAAFAEIGFERERRPFHPHLTVGRVREDRTGGRLRAAADEADCEAATQQVDAIHVIQSELRPGGAQYTSIARYELKG